MKTEQIIALWAFPVGAVTTITATVLGARLNARATRKRDEQKTREELETLADVFAGAALAVRITGYTNDYLWNGRTALLKAALMAGSQLAAGMLDPRRTGVSAIWEGTARSSALIALVDTSRNPAAASVTESLKHAVHAAMPLARHTDPHVATTTDAVLDALLRHRSQAVLDQRLRLFREAVRNAATAPDSRRSRLRAATRRLLARTARAVPGRMRRSVATGP
ncbi:hypothetical protein [Streptomyces sp. NPDC056491]|uniref:hypothetical protein n=1 Tax=Streptomyces sp. NPDC056491 TaxID=3345837 RepID=UPI0036906BB9